MISRRLFILGSAATAALANILATFPQPAAAVEPPPPAAPAPPPSNGWWGYSTNSEFFNGPFSSREEAIAAASADDYEHFETAWCEPRPPVAPDVNDDLAEWLRDEGRLPLGLVLQERAESANEDNDWEGELCAAIDGAPTHQLVQSVLEALGNALLRAGRPDLERELLPYFADVERYCDSALCTDEDVLDAIAGDQILARDIDEAFDRWFRVTGIHGTMPAVIDIKKLESHRTYMADVIDCRDHSA